MACQITEKEQRIQIREQLRERQWNVRRFRSAKYCIRESASMRLRHAKVIETKNWKRKFSFKNNLKNIKQKKKDQNGKEKNVGSKKRHQSQKMETISKFGKNTDSE